MQLITSMPAKSFWPDWNVWWKTTSIQERKKRNIPGDRVLQLGKQILEMLKSMVSSQQARFQFPIQPIVHVHGSSMDIWQIRESGRRDYCIGPGSSIILLSSSSSLFLSISLKWGMGVGGGVRLSSLYWVGVCIMYVVQCKKEEVYVIKNELTNRHHSIVTND